MFGAPPPGQTSGFVFPTPFFEPLWRLPELAPHIQSREIGPGRYSTLPQIWQWGRVGSSPPCRGCILARRDAADSIPPGANVSVWARELNFSCGLKFWAALAISGAISANQRRIGPQLFRPLLTDLEPPFVDSAATASSVWRIGYILRRCRPKFCEFVKFGRCRLMWGNFCVLGPD